MTERSRVSKDSRTLLGTLMPIFPPVLAWEREGSLDRTAVSDDRGSRRAAGTSVIRDSGRTWSNSPEELWGVRSREHSQSLSIVFSRSRTKTQGQTSGSEAHSSDDLSTLHPRIFVCRYNPGDGQ